MTSVISVFDSAILPVLSIATIGYTVGRVLSVDTDGLATISLYVLLPALVFYSLATSKIAGETIALVIFGSVTLSVVMAGLAEGVGRSLFESGGDIDGLIMTSSFPNTGNYRIPSIAFAFGAAGRSAAVLVVVGQVIATYTLEMYREMTFARHFDERAVSLQRQGRMGTYPPVVGQEASQIGSTYALREDDWVLPTYRESAVGLARGVPPSEILRYWMGHKGGTRR